MTYSVQRTLPHKEWRASNGLGLLNKESASKFALTGNTAKQTVHIIRLTERVRLDLTGTPEYST